MPLIRKKYPKGTDMWIINKLEEHDKLIQDILQLLREMKADMELSNQRIVLDVISNLNDQEDDEDEDDDVLGTEDI